MKRIPAEPKEDGDKVILVIFRTSIKGQKHQRYFLKTDKI